MAAFASAIGPQAAGNRPIGSVPLTFPVSWLARPEIEAAGRSLAGTGEIALIHETQSFTYRGPLEADRDYEMHVRISRRAGRTGRLALRATVEQAEQGTVLEMQAGLLIVAAGNPGD